MSGRSNMGHIILLCSNILEIPDSWKRSNTSYMDIVYIYDLVISLMQMMLATFTIIIVMFQLK